MSVAGHAVGSYPAFSPLPSLAVYFLWHSLSGRGLDMARAISPAYAESNDAPYRSATVPDVIRHRALMSPDFPRSFFQSPAAARLAPNSQTYLSAKKIRKFAYSSASSV